MCIYISFTVCLGFRVYQGPHEGSCLSSMWVLQGWLGDAKNGSLSLYIYMYMSSYMYVYIYMYSNYVHSVRMYACM